MDLEARPYRYFVAVADAGSFSRAAETMYVSQPALSAQIRELERRLGFKLFSRTSRRVELTTQGSLFLDRARRLIMETEWINQAARDIRTNQLRVGAAHYSAQIPERRYLLERFILNHRDISMKVTGATPIQLYAELERRDIDIAINVEPRIEPADAQSTPDEFDRLVLGRRPVEILVPAEHPLAAGDGRISSGALSGQPVVTINRAHGVAMSEAVARRLTQAGASLVHPPEGDALSAARYGALLRIPAISFGWFVAADDLANEQMMPCKADDVAFETDLVLIRSRTTQRPEAERFWFAAKDAAR